MSVVLARLERDLGEDAQRPPRPRSRARRVRRTPHSRLRAPPRPRPASTRSRRDPRRDRRRTARPGCSFASQSFDLRRTTVLDDDRPEGRRVPAVVQPDADLVASRAATGRARRSSRTRGRRRRLGEPARRRAGRPPRPMRPGSADDPGRQAERGRSPPPVPGSTIGPGGPPRADPAPGAGDDTRRSDARPPSPRPPSSLAARARMCDRSGRSATRPSSSAMSNATRVLRVEALEGPLQALPAGRHSTLGACPSAVIRPRMPHARRRLDDPGLPPLDLHRPGRGCPPSSERSSSDSSPIIGGSHGPGAVVHRQGAEPGRLLVFEVARGRLVDGLHSIVIGAGLQLDRRRRCAAGGRDRPVYAPAEHEFVAVTAE